MPMKSRPHVLLGTESHVMAWNPNLNIYRVNRYNLMSLEDRKKNKKYDESRLDYLDEFLARNLDHCAELVFSYISFEDLCVCQLTCQLWNEFIRCYIFKRKAEMMISKDESLEELADQEGWTESLYRPVEQVADTGIYKRMCAKIEILKDMWRYREPKAKRLFCDSFVLSLKADDSKIFCGLNNGCVQAWDLSYLGRLREQECHDKGVKCIDMNKSVFLTGSYDTTFKVWRKDNWTCLKTFPVHTDSVWDLKLHDTVVATAGLDGTVVLYDFKEEYDLVIRCYIQAHGDLVASVDFNSTYLVCGFEDANVGVWDVKDTTRLHLMAGHNGGVTGIQLQANIAATSSYDTLVKLWDVAAGICLMTFRDHDNFVRCIAFNGLRIVSGDFGGFLHSWDIAFQANGSVKLMNHRSWSCHKGHVVCIQMNACRIITGSRDRSVNVQDFWLKTLDSLQHKSGSGVRISRFLKRPI